MGLVGNEKVTMQTLNERLVSYSEKVRSLEEANSELEVKIRQVLEKKDPDTKDYSHYQATLDKLRKEILVMVKSNANVSLQTDNAKLAANDYRVKYENELHLRQNVEADINALKKMLDDTNVARLHLENDVISLIQVQVTENTEALKEAKTQVSVSHRQMQTLETELQTLIGSVEQYNGIILLRESELKQMRDNIQSQTLEYQALFNIKMVLEAEIATYRRLLDGEEHE
ncbi:hypothetical protein cypCar_00020992 [Cyprinus carpio]|nr:hypothetical protein cypCar_00020992 [Cyprinus carpio]